MAAINKCDLTAFARDHVASNHRHSLMEIRSGLELIISYVTTDNQMFLEVNHRLAKAKQSCK